MPKLQTNFVALKAFDPVDHNILLKKYSTVVSEE